MPKRAKRKSARSLAAKKTAATRRKRAAAEHKRRSNAAKKGWRRRKAKEEIKRKAKAQRKVKRGALKEYIVTYVYYIKKRPRVADFDAIARSREDAELFVVQAQSRGQDSKGADLTWMERIPWDEISTIPAPEEEEDTLAKKEIKALGEGWVELR
jgi:hypothetical protein